MANVDVFVFMGQSNMAGRGITTPAHPESAPTAIDGAGWEYRAVTAPDRLSTLCEPFGRDENRPGGIDDGVKKTGSMVTAFVNEYFSRTGRQVIAVSASEGGTSILQWQPDGRLLPDAVARIHAVRRYCAENNITPGGIYMLWCQGETDGDHGMTPDEYTEKFGKMYAVLREAGIERCFLVNIGHYNGPLSTDYTPIMDAIRALPTQIETTALVCDVFASMKARGLMKDDFHYFQQAYNEAGTVAARETAKLLDYSK